MMDNLNISLIPSIVPNTTTVVPYSYVKTKATKTGEIHNENVNEIIVQSEITFTWVNNDNPEDRIVVPWVIVGQQADASQAFGSGLTYCSRYFLLKYFNVATSDDDPDKWRSIQKEAQDAENKAAASAINESTIAIINQYLAEHQDQRDGIVDIVKRYAKEKGRPSANPNTITDPIVAQSLYSEIAAFCGVQTNKE